MKQSLSNVVTVEPTPTTTATPWLATVPVLASIYADAGVTPGGVRMDVFKADDRLNSRGEKIKGNGLAEYGAIIRRGRKVLIDVHRYGAWLGGRSPVQS